MTDVLAEVIDALSIRTTLFAMAHLGAPWGVSFPSGPGAYFHTVEGPGCWLNVEGQDEPTHLDSGDLALLAHGTAHRVTSSRRGAARAVFDPTTWQANTLVSATEDVEPPPVTTTLVCGAVDALTPGNQPLLVLLPRILVVNAADAANSGLAMTLDLVRNETEHARPGAQTALARLGDLLLVQLLRLWLEQADTTTRGWLPALRDPQLALALQAMHGDPAAPWTVEALAQRALLSRSRFAERFTTTTGATPLAYLTRWRMTLAARMLRDGQPVHQVCRAVGYTSDAAFSRAFTRHHGQPPSRLRPHGPRPS